MEFDKKDAERFFNFLNHEKLTEIRIIHSKEGLKGQFWVDNLNDFLILCEKFSGKYNVYVGVNERRTKGGKAEHVGRLSIIPLDIDPIRPKGIASTEEELKLAHQKLKEIGIWLKEEFNCEPFISMSGNGYHLYIKIPSVLLDEFNRDTIKERLKTFIREIQSRFIDDKVRIDSTFDLPRVMKCPGTLSVKGDNTQQRPWRVCKIIQAKDEPCVKVRDYLAKIKVQENEFEASLGTKTRGNLGALLKEDEKMKDLFEGGWRKHGFPSRSEAEQSLLTKLVFHGFSEDAIRAIMTQSKIGKWQEKSDAYHHMSISKAMEFVKKHGKPFEGKTKEVKRSCGEDLPDKVFEQISNREFLVYSKETSEATKQKTVEGFKPHKKIVWKTVDDIEVYESESQLWIEVRQYLYEHIDLPEGYDILTAWVFASWIPEKWHAVPYLFFYGPPGSGKTWALEILGSVGFRPFMTAATTLAVMFRACDVWHPTLFLDETEAYMRKERGEIMHLLNAGYRKGFPATRIEETKDGFKIKVFDCFGFKALAGTKGFAQALKSRCIILNMSKATRKVETKIDFDRAERLRKMLLMYRFKMLSKREELELPDVLTGRLKELFDPLIMVAPPEAKQSIIGEAEKIREITEEEERTSDEAMIFKAVFHIHQQDEERKITIEDIGRLVNRPLGIDEQISNVSIGMTLSRLGFKKTLHEGKRAIFWSQRLADRLKRRYLTAQGTGDLTAFSEEGT